MPTSDPADPERAASLAALEPDSLARELDALVSQGEAALPLLTALEARAPDRESRKLVRRALHRLRSRGVSNAEPARERRASVLRPLESAEGEALCTGLDSLGQRMVVLLEARAGGARILEALLSDVQGVLRLEGLQGTRGRARRLFRETLERNRTAWLRLPAAEARALARRAESARTEGSAVRTVAPDLLEELLRPGVGETPGERTRRELEGEAAGLDSRKADELLGARVEQRRLPLFAPPVERLRELAREVQSVASSPLVLSEVQRRERTQEIALRGRRELFDGPTRTLFAERLEGTAAGWLAGGDREGAVALVQLAARLRAPAEGSVEPPYLGACFAYWLAAVGDQERPEKTGRLIVPA